MPATFRQVEEAFAARVLALDASAYQQGTPAPVKWRESSVPLTVVQDASSLGHLLFNVWIQAAPNTDLHRDASWKDEPDDPDNTVWIEARCKAVFTFRLRPTRQVADTRIAADAALDIARALMAEWSADDVAEYGPINVRLVDGLQPSLTPDGEWLLIVQDYTAGFELDLVP